MATADEVIARASAALDTGMEGAVLADVAAAIRRFPADARLWQMLGLLYRSLDDLNSAAQAMARAANLDTASSRIAHAHARIVMESGAPSLPLFERALKLAPADGDLLLSWSAAMLAEGRLTEVVDTFDRLLEANPLWTSGHSALAQLRWLAGDTDHATASLDRALQEHPAATGLWLEKINLLVRAARFDDASKAAAEARLALGELPALTLNAAICASELGEVERADHLFAALDTVTDVAIATRFIRHLLRTGRADQAARLGETFVQHPGADHIWPYLSVAWRLLGEPRWDWLEGDPRMVGSYDIGEALGSIDELAETLRALHTARMEPLDQSVRGGTQTDGPLFARIDPVIQTTRAAVVDAVSRHLAALPDDPGHPHLRYRRTPIRFAGSWSVRLTGGGHHSNHVHPQGFVSSALYVIVPGQSDSGPPPAGHLVLGQPPAELGIDLPPIRMIAPKPGHLALFPSTMWHGTMPFAGGERMTVAFDIAKPRQA